ncbi:MULTISPECIES: substrate-binding domain-containing protein [unclassified Pseudofrankia]|uniref:sugar ABC transporter substrate-binding protein n=1 Tax=unclassified Pseudofrankia TaxID=2994372 RepID=UPI0008DA1C40|nr:MULTISPECIES: substrate-binding domain-containing protein [unclassified Pseudofrankia]MDT3444959.1 substrate-binding domain-containing protein [Pseudofrankia sp. BMG5.37]OHV47341.1 hypothetical protein BCD48_18395 [Pseudofrankia sp. BMG5.36]
MKFRWLAAVTAGLVVALAGCGGASGGSEGTPGSGGTAAANLQETAKAKVDGYIAVPESYPGPTTPFDPGTGRTAVMACGFGAPVCAEQARFAVDAVHKMGWESPPAFDGQFSPQVQAGFVDRAVQDKLDGIILVSVDVNGIRASIDRAIAAGMPIMCTMCVSGPDYEGKGVTDVTVDFEQQGEIAAWKILADRGKDAKAVTYFDPAFSSSVNRSIGMTKIFKENCPGCAFAAMKFPSIDVSKPGPPQFTSLLASRPKGTITNFQATYDGLAVPAANTVRQIGRTDVTVSGYDGSPEALAAIVSQNPPLEFTIGEPYTYAEWAAADLLARTKAGEKLWSNADKLPSTLIVRSTAQKYLDGNPAGSSYPAPAGAWQGNFLKLWGKP